MRTQVSLSPASSLYFGSEHTVVGNLVTQRNAIRMLYERIAMIAEYIDAVSQSECGGTPIRELYPT